MRDADRFFYKCVKSHLDFLPNESFHLLKKEKKKEHMAVQRTFWSTRREKKKKAQHERAAYQIFHQGQSPTQAPTALSLGTSVAFSL